MPDCVTFDLFSDQPRAALWPLLGSPELYPRFFRGVGSVERTGTTGRHPRYRIRLTLSGRPVEHDMRVLLSRREEQLVLETVPDTGGCLSVRLFDDPHGTRLKVIYFRPGVPSPGRAPGPADVRSWAQDGLERIHRHLRGTAEAWPPDRPPSTRQVANTLIAAGILTPARPDRVVRQLRALARWGATLAGGYTAAAARSPRGVAVIDEDGARTTFAALSTDANRLAAALQAVGVGPHGTVAIMARNHSAMVKTLLACGRLGASTVLLNTGLARPQVAHAVDRHDVRVLVADGEFAPLVAGLPLTAVLLTGADDGPPGQPTLTEVIADTPDAEFAPPERPAPIVVLTSGTTGTPKGARRPTPKGLGAAVALLSRIPLRAGERILMAAPLFHSWGLSALQVGMPLRATLVMQRRFDPEACLRAIQEHRCTAVFAVPVMLQRIMARCPRRSGRGTTPAASGSWPAAGRPCPPRSSPRSRTPSATCSTTSTARPRCPPPPSRHRPTCAPPPPPPGTRRSARDWRCWVRRANRCRPARSGPSSWATTCSSTATPTAPAGPPAAS